MTRPGDFGERVVTVTANDAMVPLERGKYLVPRQVSVRFRGTDAAPGVRFVARMNDAGRVQVVNLRFDGVTRPAHRAADWDREAHAALIWAAWERTKDGNYQPPYSREAATRIQGAATKAAAAKRHVEKDTRAREAAAHYVRRDESAKLAAADMGVSLTTFRTLYAHARTLDPSLPPAHKRGRRPTRSTR